MFRHREWKRGSVGLKWAKKVYYGETAKKKKRLIKRWLKKRYLEKKVRQGTILPMIYVISFSAGTEDLFDIIPAWTFSQKGYPVEKITVLGVALGKKEALELAEQLVMKVYLETGEFRVRDFFE